MSTTLSALQPSTAAKEYFRTFDVHAARALVRKYKITPFTSEKLVECSLWNAYRTAMAPEAEDTNKVGLAFEEMENFLDSPYGPLAVRAKRELRKRGFVCTIDEDVHISWPTPSIQEMDYRFIEMLPNEVTAQALTEIMRANRIEYAGLDAVEKIALTAIMVCAADGLPKNEIRFGRDGIFECPKNFDRLKRNRAGVRVDDLIAGAKARLEARGFAVDIDKHGCGDRDLQIYWDKRTRRRMSRA